MVPNMGPERISTERKEDSLTGLTNSTFETQNPWCQYSQRVALSITCLDCSLGFVLVDLNKSP